MLPTGVPGVSAARLADWVRGIEAGPFSSVGVADRIRYANPDPMLTMAVAAALTERVRIMSLVTLPALRPGPLFAKEVATLTQLAPGRLTLGVGPGARRTDYDLLELPWSRRGATLDAHLDRLMGLRDPASEQELGPRLGEFELLVGGASAPALRRMTTHGHGYVGGGLKPAVFAFEAAAAVQAWRAAGRDGEPRLVASTWFSMHPDPDDASAAHLRAYLHQGGPPPPVNSGISRGAGGIAEAVRAFRAQGAHEVVFFPMDDDPAQLEWLAGVVAELPEHPRGEPTPDPAALGAGAP
jgi:alkanesulfonate monooxygenase SsuD/methylene tetrahydromethanopterin reductase-like flavin-dependent oxidoreductase (luciferase family)